MNKKVIIITGANGGIGKAIAKTLLEEYEIIAIDLKGDNLIDLPVEFYQCDLTKKEEIISTFNRVKDKKVFAIINCVGIFMMQSIIEGKDDDFKKIIDVNFFAIYEFNKIFFPLLENGSRIINLTSEVVRLSTQPFMGYYSLSKILLDNYTDTLRREASYLNIKVIKVRSGNMATPLVAGAAPQFEKMLKNSEHFSTQLTKLKYMMDRELEKSHNPEIIAHKIKKILSKKHPRIKYNVKNSFYLTLIGVLPEKWQDRIYQKVIK